MNTKVVVGLVSAGGVAGIIALAVFLLFPPNPGSHGQAPPQRPEVEKAAGADRTGRPRRGDSEGFPSADRSPASQAESRTQLGRSVRESQVAGRDTSGRFDAASGTQGSTSRRRALHEQDREDSRDPKKKRSQGGSGDNDLLRGLPLGFAGETTEADASEPDADVDVEPPSKDELERKDLDLDEEIAPWEIEKTRRLQQRAKNYATRGDKGDGAYPIERDGAAMTESSFDRVDGNGDGLLDQDEYYLHLVNSEKILIRLDTDADRQISLEESGLSPDEFRPFDHNFNERLSDQETQKAVAAGVFD